VGDISRRGVIHGGKADLGAKVGVSEVLKEFGSSSLGNPGCAIDDEVLVQAHGVTVGGFDGEGDPAVVADISHLAVLRKMGRYDLVAVKTGPDHGYLGAAVWVQGHQVSQGRGVEHSFGAVGQRRRHEVTLAVQAADVPRSSEESGGWLMIEVVGEGVSESSAGSHEAASASSGYRLAGNRGSG
jgi:hypothetical protein